MALDTVTAGVRPANPVHALQARIAAAFSNDNDGCWTDDPRAQRLLASCAERSPVGQWHNERTGWGGGQWFAYVGYRAEALQAIRDEHGARVHAAYMAQGDEAYPAFDAWCRSPSVTDAIEAAVPAVLPVAMEA
jgi:hypothetical protein